MAKSYGGKQKYWQPDIRLKLKRSTYKDTCFVMHKYKKALILSVRKSWNKIVQFKLGLIAFLCAGMTGEGNTKTHKLRLEAAKILTF